MPATAAFLKAGAKVETSGVRLGVAERHRRRNSAISDDKARPKYENVARELKRAIISGDYPVGSRLPTEGQLCGTLGVSRYTLREAMRLLREEKLIETRRKAGTFVMPPQPNASNFHHALSIDDLLAFSARWQFSTVSTVFAPLPKDLAQWAEVSEDGDWLTVAGVAQAQGSSIPENFATYYINSEFAAIGRIFSEHAGRILPLIESMFGEQIVVMVQQITAGLVPSKLVSFLQVEKGSPVIMVRSLYRAESDKVALITTEIYPASRFHYVKTLRRAGATEAARP